jgi:hypothetical protein
MGRMQTSLAALLFAAVLLPPLTVTGQVTLPSENHFWTYHTGVNHTSFPALTLRDQFGTIVTPAAQGGAAVMDFFSTPAEKIHNGQVFPILDPVKHLTWWALGSTQPLRNVIVIDQFGGFSVTVGDTRFLLAPALKSLQGSFPLPFPDPPVGNHYLCYQVVDAEPIFEIVDINDQFGTHEQVQVLHMQYLCNPVEKTVTLSDGTTKTYPIVDARAHLAVYQVANVQTDFHFISSLDQFGVYNQSIQTGSLAYLAVPALKEYSIRTERSTWGQIKALYR